jgi:hypothetical protein
MDEAKKKRRRRSRAHILLKSVSSALMFFFSSSTFLRFFCLTMLDAMSTKAGVHGGYDDHELVVYWVEKG